MERAIGNFTLTTAIRRINATCMSTIKRSSNALILIIIDNRLRYLSWIFHMINGDEILFIYNNFSFSCLLFELRDFPSSFAHSSIFLLGWIFVCLIFLNEYLHTFNHLLESFIDPHPFKSTRLQESHIVLQSKLLSMFLCFYCKITF